MPSSSESRPVAGLLLTGGASRRMGFDKAAIRIAGEPLARRTGRLLAAVCEPAFEVGPGRSELETVTEPRPGEGPLTALACGASALREVGVTGPVIVLATDLPGLDLALLRRLAQWPGTHTVLPRLAGRAQPLCARWSPAALGAAVDRAAAGERNLRWLADQPDVEFADDLDPLALADVDTPAALAATGLDWRAP